VQQLPLHDPQLSAAAAHAASHVSVQHVGSAAQTHAVTEALWQQGPDLLTQQEPWPANVPAHLPAAHTSFEVHLFPSLQPTVLFVYLHPEFGSQVSVVQTFLSSHTTGVPLHAPPEHTSPVVQAVPSLHAAVLFSYLQPVAGSQESVVQGLVSLQTTGVVTHLPPAHTSPDVHLLPSSHGAVLLVCVHPEAGTHASVVHGLSSLQLSAGPGTHLPPAHTSPAVHALPSSHALVLGACTQPAPSGSQESVVQRLPSSQLTGFPLQVPAAHTSPVVHALPSLHGLVVGVLTQPEAGLHESAVHWFPSLQSAVGPGAHTPFPSQPSLRVHALPSVHGEPTGW
jgi:hypothetical protein